MIPEVLIGSSHGRAQKLALAVGDLAALAGCALLSWWLKRLADPWLPAVPYLQVLPLLLLAVGSVYASLGLYPGLGMGSATELRRLSKGTSLVFLSGIALTFALRSENVWSRQVILATWILALFAVPLGRAVVRRICCRRSWWGIPCVVLGAGSTGTKAVNLLLSRPRLGLRPVALLDDDPAKQGIVLDGLPVSGPVLEQAAALSRRGVHHGILAMPCLTPERRSQMLDALGDHFRHVHIVPALPGSPDVIADTREFANTLVLEVRQELLLPSARLAKRIQDLIAAGLGFLLFWWLLAGIALLVRLSSPGPVIYGQRRMGQGGREFTAWKFRSMVADADTLLEAHLERHPGLRAEWERDRKLRNDPRVTAIGRLLRRTSLDELPQLWNVLRGEMSLVGPRPIVREEIGRYGGRFALYSKIHPGMTGLWTVSGRSDTSYAERVALDCYYVRNWSVWLDLVILARTVRVVLFGKGAY